MMRNKNNFTFVDEKNLRKTDIGIHCSDIFIFMLQCMLFDICNKAAFGFGVIYCKSPCFLNFSKNCLENVRGSHL